VTARLQSIRTRLARALLAWSVLWGLAVAAAVWLAVQHEVDELLDDTLRASAEVLGTLLRDGSRPLDEDAVPDGRFAWQVIGPGGHVLQRSALSPAVALHAAPAAGFGDVPLWRVYGVVLRHDGTMLYVAQTRAERLEAQAEVAVSTVLAALAIGALGHLWLRVQVRRELEPLQSLSDRLARHEPLDGTATLGPAERLELQPVQDAIDDLARRLALRMAHERAFTAHAAHALRTPLAGIDAQLAVALRECAPDVQPRIQRARDAAGRLQRVVAALLALFRTGGELQREPVDVASLLGRLPVEGLAVQVQEMSSVDADPDLLAAALLNLLDNALRHGARSVVVSLPSEGTVRLHDDGPGVQAARRRELQRALDHQAYAGNSGLGLMLADLVARSHGGGLALPEVASGFAVDIALRGPR
jgi:signal transduction histidine kinase